LLASCFMLVSCLTYSSVLKMEATFSQNAGWLSLDCAAEDWTLHNHHCENLESAVTKGFKKRHH
jgi:hypothetical protein